MSKKRTKKQVKENKKLKLSVKRTLKYMFGAEWRKSGLYRLCIRKARKPEFRHFIKRNFKHKSWRGNENYSRPMELMNYDEGQS